MRKIKNLIKSLPFASIILATFMQFAPNTAFSQFFTGPVLAGVGGAGRAALDPLEGIFLNPAGLTHLKNYYMGVYWVDSSGLEQNQVRDLSVIIADSTPDKLFPGGFAFTKRRISSPNLGPVDQKDYYLAIADYVVSRLSLGISAHRLESDFGNESHDQHNVNIGLLFTPTENIGIALVGHDLLGPGSSIPAELQLKRKVGLGFTYIFANFLQARLDWDLQLKDNPENESRLMLGIESALHQFFDFRVGAQWDDLAKQTFLSTGFSFNGPRLALDYAYQKEVQSDGGGHRHLVDLRLKF